ncbi:MAG: MBL fold metallo-hydrolase [Firmicutes bacterium]|nr:MBL fold metallo-hydrolase [Bacillota bacterium]
MILKRIPVGSLMANCYLFGDAATKEVVVIDPGDDADKILEAIKTDGLTVKYIAITHSHFDHVGAIDRVKTEFNVPIASEDFTVGSRSITIIKTPGHSPDGVCLSSGGVVFTGDTLFKGSIGRCDLEGGDFDVLKKSVKKLYSLPDDTAVYPGHGLSTTIGREKHTNPFVRANS